MTFPLDFTVLRQAVRNYSIPVYTANAEIQQYIDVIAMQQYPSTIISDDPFLLAVKRGRVDIVDAIISKAHACSSINFLANKKDPNGFYSIHLAAANNHEQVVNMLLRKMPNLCRKRDRKGRTALHHAIVNSYPEMMKIILEKNVDAIDDCTHKRETCFHIAVKYKRFEEFKVLIEFVKNYPDKIGLLNNDDTEGNNVLHIAVSDKLFKIVKCIVPNGDALCDINMENAYGLTALNLCCRGEKDPLIESVLINAGAQKAMSWMSLIDPIIHSTTGERQVMLVIPSVAAAGALALIGSPLETNASESTKQKEDLHIQDVLKHPFSKFYGALALTFMFMLAILVMCLAVWSVPARLSLVALLLISVVYYAIALATKMADFNIICGLLHFPSHCLVWIGVLISYLVVGLIITLNLLMRREVERLGRRLQYFFVWSQTLNLPLQAKTP